MDLTINLPRGSIVFYGSSRIFYVRNVLEIRCNYRLFANRSSLPTKTALFSPISTVIGMLEAEKERVLARPGLKTIGIVPMTK